MAIFFFILLLSYYFDFLFGDTDPLDSRLGVPSISVLACWSLKG